MQSLTSSNSVEEPEGTYNELLYSDKGFKAGDVAGQFVDKLHLYKKLTSADSTMSFS